MKQLAIFAIVSAVLCALSWPTSASVVWDGSEYTGKRPSIRKPEVDRALLATETASRPAETVAGCWFCDASREWWPFFAALDADVIKGATVPKPDVNKAYMWLD